MAIETEITGNPGSIEAASSWLRDTLAPAMDRAADTFNNARKSVETHWESPAGDAYRDMMWRGFEASYRLEEAARGMATELDDFAHGLRRCQEGMASVRSSALAAGLDVQGFVVEDPGFGPDYPAPPQGPEDAAEFERQLDVWSKHQSRVSAYLMAEGEAARLDRKYAAICRDLEHKYTITEHAAWLVTLNDVLGKAAVPLIVAGGIALRKSRLQRSVDSLMDDAARIVADIQARPALYMKRKWLIFQTFDKERFTADWRALQGKRAEAADLIKQIRALDHVTAPKVFKHAGRVLSALGFGLGAYGDWEDGETNLQILTSQGAAAAAAWGAVGTGAALGAACGSVVPGVGTVVGGVVGAIVGIGVSVFVDGAVDSVFENGFDVGKAFSEGVEALEETGSSLVGVVSSWFK